MIKATDFTKRFDGKVAVNALDIEIEKGRIYGLVGTNGSGKSTFLRTVSGVYYADGGSITVDGEPVYENINAKSKVFFVSDDMYFLPNSSMEDMSQMYKGLYPTWSQEKYEKLASRFPLDKNARVKTFSKGMRRQAAIILALSCQPKYLLLDEAFDGLDPVIRVAVRKLIADEVAENDMTVVISSHNLRELEDFCDTVGILHKGQLVMQHTMDALSDRFCKIQVAFGKDSAFSTDNLNDDRILSCKKSGSVYTIACAMGCDDAEKFMSQYNPIFVDYIPLTLEEVFVYEMEAIGYDTNNIIF
ncbi:MAG: ABC transporter ATP-binding protein [Oscillospiraceae bacterium]|nr:ABC transporter ATP-binding protein [Oscillospiraceae bacterium]